MKRNQFKDDIKKFLTKSDYNLAQIYIGSVEGALRSIQYGSPITSSPGQPEESGDLINSWVSEALGARQARIYSDSPYAPQNEDGVARPGGGPYTQRSSVGGRWSVRKTRENYEKIVDDIARKLARGRASRSRRK